MNAEPGCRLYFSTSTSKQICLLYIRRKRVGVPKIVFVSSLQSEEEEKQSQNELGSERFVVSHFFT